MPKSMKIQRKSLPEKLSKQCSQKDEENLAKNVPWGPPGFQNGSPDGPQETPDGCRKVLKRGSKSRSPLGTLLGPQKDTKMTPKWYQNYTKMVPKFY